MVGGEEEGLGEVAQPGQLPRVSWSHRQVVTNAAVVPKLVVSVALKQVNMSNMSRPGGISLFSKPSERGVLRVGVGT